MMHKTNLTFLVAGDFDEDAEGYPCRESMCEHMQVGSVIGRFDAQGHFVLNAEMTLKYAEAIPEMVAALALSPRDELYRRYKLAAMDKASLDLYLEWLPSQALGQDVVKLKFAQSVCESMGLDLLLVDFGGPCYEVLMPNTVEPILQGLSGRARVALNSQLEELLEGCVSPWLQGKRRENICLEEFTGQCNQCPSLCRVDHGT